MFHQQITRAEVSPDETYSKRQEGREIIFSIREEDVARINRFRDVVAERLKVSPGSRFVTSEELLEFIDYSTVGMAKSNTLVSANKDIDFTLTAPYRIVKAIDFLGFSADLTATTLDFVIKKIERHGNTPQLSEPT